MWWVALQACVPWLSETPDDLPPEVPVAPPVEEVHLRTPFPSAPATFRPECLGGWDGKTGALAPSRGLYPMLLPMLLPSCASSPEEAAPTAAEPAAAPVTEPAEVVLGLPDPMLEPEPELVPAPSPAPPPFRQDPRTEQEVVTTEPSGPRALPKPSPRPPAPELRRKREARIEAPAERRQKPNEEPVVVDLPPVRQRTSTLDWGGTVFLSNDDSMSLASAQRVLYALSHGVSVQPSQVRPHELLNYFSFDTVTPVEGQTFGVLGAAERDGDRLTVSLAVRGASPPRPPLDLTLVVDRSGSMNQEGKLVYTKRALAKLAENLHPGDRVDVVTFDTGVCVPLEGYVVGRDNPAWLAATINGITTGGGTDLGAGLDAAYRIQTARTTAETHGRARRVVVVTDALLNSGNVEPSVVSEVGAAFDEHGIRLSGVGVGRDFDDEMLDLLTEKGRGAYVYLGSEAVVDRVFGSGFDSLVQTVANDVRFSLDLPPSLAMEKFYGEEMSAKKAEVEAIHYQAGTTQLFLQDLKIRDGELVPGDPVSVRIEYRDAVTNEPAVQELRTTVGALLDSDPHNVRKGRALMAFSDLVMTRALGGEACAAPLDTYRSRITHLTDDAEIAYVNGLVGKTCGVSLSTVAARGVELKVRVDADVPVDGVAVQCGGRDQREGLAPNDTIALFSSVQPGACTVRLEGTALATQVEVSQAGSDLRCVVRGGRVNCG